MKHCSKCNTDNPDNFKTCWSCGSALPNVPNANGEALKTESRVVQRENRCKKCGKKITSNAWKCLHCGAPNSTYLIRIVIPIVSLVLLVAIVGVATIYGRAVEPDVLDSNAKSANVKGGAPIKKSISTTKQRPTLFGIELGITVVSDNSDLLAQLGVVKVHGEVNAKSGKRYRYFFKPRRKFRSFTDYFFDVDPMSKKVSTIHAISRGPFGDQQAKDEVNMILTLLKAKYGIPHAYTKEEHWGGEVYFDDWEYSVQINARYSIRVTKTYRRSKGYTIGITLEDSMSNLRSEDVDAL